MLIPIQQAAADALASWLQSGLSGATVKAEWAGPDSALADRTVTITMLGKLQLDWHDPVQLSYTSPVSGQTASVWRVANCSQVYQLDVWCQSPATRLDVEATIEPLLRRGAYALNQVTGLLYPTVPQQDPFDQDVLLPFAATYDGAASPWAGGTCSFLFDGTSIFDDPDSVKGGEFRSTRRGTGWFALTLASTDPAMSDISINLRTLSWWSQQAANVPAPIMGFAPPQGFQYGYGQQLDTPPNANPTFSGL